MVILHHRDLGGSGRPPLLLLHGLLGSSRNWQSAGAELAASFHVLALDLRNHGRSPHADTMGYPEMVDDVLAWMNRHGLPAAALAGHSMGGKVAMLLACRHPDRVRRLAVIDIAPRDYSWPAHRASFAAMNELELRDLRSRADAELRFEGRVPDWGVRKFLATNLEQGGDGRWGWQINLPALTRALPDLERNPLGGDDGFAGESLFVAGGRSTYITPEDHPAIRRHFRRARVEVIPGSGHNPHMETRSALVALLRGPVPPGAGATDGQEAT